MDKLTFSGMITSVQPRIRLVRSFDEASHNYLGYCLSLQGVIGEEEREFSIAIGQAAHSKHQFRVGDHISGACVLVADEWLEPAEFYKVSKLKKSGASTDHTSEPPPWQDLCPDLATYRWRGHRRLSANTYSVRCTTCMWGCRMPVEIIVDHWDPRGKKKYRFETFCYGPLNCKFYKAGPNRKVEGRNGMVYVEEDWVDEEMTRHRGLDE